MNDYIPVKAPGGFAPAVGLGTTDAAGNLVLVGPDNPLPVAGGMGSGVVAAPPPLQGTTTVALTAGPFGPVPGRAVYVELRGEWTGEVRLLRSTDGGATRSPITLAGAPWGLYTGNVCEPAWEESEVSAALFLELAPASGTIAYRVSQ